MYATIRNSLLACAVVSLLAFSTPALAGMCDTPAPRAGVERAEALAALEGRLAGSGAPMEQVREALEKMDTSELQTLAQSSHAMQSAGYHWFIISVLFVGLVVVACIAIYFGSHRQVEHHWHDAPPREKSEPRPEGSP